MPPKLPHPGCLAPGLQRGPPLCPYTPNGCKAAGGPGPAGTEEKPGGGVDGDRRERTASPSGRTGGDRSPEDRKTQTHATCARRRVAYHAHNSPPLGRQGPGLPGAAQPPEHPSRVLDGWRARPGRDHGEAEGGVDEDKGNGGPSRPGGRVGNESPATRGTKDYHRQPPVAAPIRDTGANTLCHPRRALGRARPGSPQSLGGRGPLEAGTGGTTEFPKSRFWFSRAFQRY